jgi:putative membrane-bound dehydrogenase-like protein
MRTLSKMMYPKGLCVSLCTLFAVLLLASRGYAQENPSALKGQLSTTGIWHFRVEMSADEYRAMEPVTQQPAAFGGPDNLAPAIATDPNRASVLNLFGTRFPWVKGQLFVERDDKVQQHKCRIRYDGDFTYLLSAGSPKRPMMVELVDGETIDGHSAFRLHTMQFDPDLVRERIAAHMYSALKVPVTRVGHVQVEFVIGDNAPQSLGLYAVVEVVSGDFLANNGIATTSLVMQFNGLNSIQYLGDEWSAYAPMFRTARIPSKAEQDRIIAFAKWVLESSDSEFKSRLSEFIDVDSMLRYIAAGSMTSNLTGFATIGANDYLVLDPQGKFHLIASELEIALGGSVLSGTPEQLSKLSIVHPFAGDCKIIDRLFAQIEIKEAYLQILRDSIGSAMAKKNIVAVVESIESDSAIGRAEEAKIQEARMALAVGGLGGPPIGGPGFGNAPSQLPITARKFVELRVDSVSNQLAGIEQGYVPVVPSFGNNFGPPNRQGAEAPISTIEFEETVHVPAGFQATLFAKSPEVNYPVSLAAEPTGAIYVASDEQGSLGTDKEGGKILRCVDSDGDGAADTVTTFCKADHVRGVVYRDGSVWVCHPPFLSVFHDDNGDGVADRSKQLVTGLTTDLVNTRGGDHTTNCIRIGIDGWIYIGDGDYGILEAKGMDGSTVSLRGGGILRVRPDGTELELFSSGLRNPFDIAIDPLLNMYTRDNTNDGGGWDTRVSQLYQSAEYGYPRLFANFSDEIMPPLGAFGGGGGTGSYYIDDDSWPHPYNQSLFTSDWGRSAVFHHPLVTDGATHQLTQESFATVPRATGMDMDAMGNLYVASWWSGEASVYVGPQVGFVTRITPKNQPVRRIASYGTASLSELKALLQSNQAVVRWHAQAELIHRGQDAAVIAALTDVVLDKNFLLAGRVAAMFALKQLLGEQSHSLLFELTKDEGMRALAIRALTDRKGQLSSIDANLLTPFLADESPIVIAQTLVALGRIGDTKVAELVIPFAEQAEVERPDPALPNSSQVIPHLALRTLLELDAVDACLKALDGDYWRASLRALRYMHSASAVNGLIERLHSERDTDRRAEILFTLVRLYQQETPYDGSWWGIRPDTTGPYYDPMTWEASSKIAEVLFVAISEADSEFSNALRMELARHQVDLPGLTSTQVATIEESRPIVIEPVDPQMPNQIGNRSYEDVLATTLAAKETKLRENRFSLVDPAILATRRQQGKNRLVPIWPISGNATKRVS